jgi:hypothetical protein
MPSPQSARQKEFEARVKQIGAELAKKHGITRRRFFKTAGGMAARSPEDMQKKYGFAPLGAANGPVKNGIFGLNSAKLYNYTPKQQAAVLTDRLARCKETYDREGGDRTNLVYGYINKG